MQLKYSNYDIRMQMRAQKGIGRTGGERERERDPGRGSFRICCVYAWGYIGLWPSSSKIFIQMVIISAKLLPLARLARS